MHYFLLFLSLSFFILFYFMLYYWAILRMCYLYKLELITWNIVENGVVMKRLLRVKRHVMQRRKFSYKQELICLCPQGKRSSHDSHIPDRVITEHQTHSNRLLFLSVQCSLHLNSQTCQKKKKKTDWKYAPQHLSWSVEAKQILFNVLF